MYLIKHPVTRHPDFLSIVSEVERIKIFASIRNKFNEILQHTSTRKERRANKREIVFLMTLYMFRAGTDKIRYFQKLLLSETNNLDAQWNVYIKWSTIKEKSVSFGVIKISTVTCRYLQWSGRLKNERNSESWQYESDIYMKIRWNIYGANNKERWWVPSLEDTSSTSEMSKCVECIEFSC